MELLQNTISTSIMAQELKMEEAEIEAYYRNYYIHRTLPIRNLTPNEIQLVRYYKDIRFAAKPEIVEMCVSCGMTYDEYITDMWVLPKTLIRMPDEEYRIAMRYASVLLEPYVNYDNYKGPRLTPLNKEEIAMLLSNIAVGITILPEDQITSRVSMEAMDRLLKLYEDMPRDTDGKVNQTLRKLDTKKLELLVKYLTGTVDINPKLLIPTDLPKTVTKPKGTPKKKPKNALNKIEVTNVRAKG